MAFLQIDYKSEALMRGVNVKVILPSDGMADLNSLLNIANMLCFLLSRLCTFRQL